MTGFARVVASGPRARLVWELKSVNAKGLDLRLRLPSGFDAIEPEIRNRLGGGLARGTCQATLSLQRDAAAPDVKLNGKLLADLAAALATVPPSLGLAPASLDGLLAVRGVVEVAEAPEDEAESAALRAAVLTALDDALAALVATRRQEGAALASVLATRLDRIEALTRAADAAPGRRTEAVLARLQQAVAQLSATAGLDPVRLHQEALLMAAKADIREELDRLSAHVAAARDLLGQGGAVGRRLDFLAQEFGRESNTLCAKSNDAALTGIGLDLRVEVEQFREQVQNIE